MTSRRRRAAMFVLNAIQRVYSTPVDRRSLLDTSVLFRCRTMDKSSPDEQRRFDASNDQILLKGWHWNAETLESKLTEIDAAMRKLNEDFDNCRHLIVVMMRSRNVLDGQMLRLASYRHKWLKSLHRAENYRRNLIEMESRGLNKNRKKSNDPYDGAVMSASEAKEFRDRLDWVTNDIMANMVVAAKLKTKVQSDRIDHENTTETLFALGANIARQRRLTIDIRNSLMAIKSTMKDEN